MTSRVINIIDPGLNKSSGHHYDWNKKLHDYYQQQGFSVRVYCNSNTPADALASFEHAVPLFSGYPYRHTKNMAQELHWLLAMTESFQKELASVQPADYHLFTTLFDYQLVALSTSHLCNNIRAAIHFSPNQRNSQLGAAMWASGFKRCIDNKKAVGFLATTPEIKALYAKMYGIELGVLPHIYDVAPVRQATQQGVRVVGFLGEQRVAKGVQLIPDIVKWLVGQGYYVICQDSSGKIAQSNSSERFEVLGYVEDMIEVISRCDLIVTPYDPQWYRYNMAGVVIESLCCGVPVIAPQGTSAGNLVELEGAGKTFTEFNAPSVIEAIEAGFASYNAIKAGAEQTRIGFERNHGLKHFADKFISD